MDMKSNYNQSRIDIIKNSLKASFGLFIFAFGVYLTIQANIGVSPWDTFNIGLSQKLNVLYGTVSITISLLIVGIDVLMKEKIGIGTLVCTLLEGPIMQFDFDLMKFDPTKLKHQDIMTSFKILFK